MEKGQKFSDPDGMPRQSLEFDKEQKHLAFRQEVKKWREAGFNRRMSHIVAREITRKPTQKGGNG